MLTLHGVSASAVAFTVEMSSAVMWMGPNKRRCRSSSSIGSGVAVRDGNEDDEEEAEEVEEDVGDVPFLVVLKRNCLAKRRWLLVKVSVRCRGSHPCFKDPPGSSHQG